MSVQERAVRMYDFVLTYMRRFGSLRPIPNPEWFEGEIQSALEERDREWSAALLGHPHDGSWLSEKMCDPSFAAGFVQESIKQEVEAAVDAAKGKNRICGDCRRQLPSGHPNGFCPAREDGYF